jgi:peroxiredoxin
MYMTSNRSIREPAAWLIRALLVALSVAALAGCSQPADSALGVPSTPASAQSTPPTAAEPTDEAAPAALQPAVDGQPAPAFALKDLDGRQIRLQDLRGKRVLLVFLATWCTECRAELPALQELYQTQDGRNLAVFAVDTMEPAIAVQRFLRRNAVSFPVLLDDQGAVALAYDARMIPSSAFIDSSGVLVRREIGNITVEQVDTLLQEVR